jgi:hypothetical protein
MSGQRRTKASLSIPEQQLLEILQFLRFGRIEQLGIHDGQPMLEGDRIIREIKRGSKDNLTCEPEAEDFELKSERVELFECLRRFNDGVVEVLEFRHGLPFRLVVEHHANSAKQSKRQTLTILRARDGGFRPAPGDGCGAKQAT